MGFKEYIKSNKEESIKVDSPFKKYISDNKIETVESDSPFKKYVENQKYTVNNPPNIPVYDPKLIKEIKEQETDIIPYDSVLNKYRSNYTAPFNPPVITQGKIKKEPQILPKEEPVQQFAEVEPFTGFEGAYPGAKPIRIKATPQLTEEDKKQGLIKRSLRDLGSGAAASISGMARFGERSLRHSAKGWDVFLGNDESEVVDDKSMRSIIWKAVKSLPADQYNRLGDAAKVIAEGSDFISGKLAVENPNFYDKLVSGVGSSLPSYIPAFGVFKLIQGASMATKLAKVMVGLKLGKDATKLGDIINSSIASIAGGILEGGIDSGLVWNEAKLQGKSDSEADKIANTVFWQEIPMNIVTDKLGVFGNTKTLLSRAISSVISGSAQEGGAQMIQNRALGKPIWEGVGEASGIGAIISGGLGTVQHVAEKTMLKQQELYGAGEPGKTVPQEISGSGKSGETISGEKGLTPEQPAVNNVPLQNSPQDRMETAEGEGLKVETDGKVQIDDERTPIVFEPEPVKQPVDPDVQKATEDTIANYLNQIDTMPEADSQGLVRDLTMGRDEFIRTMATAQQGGATNLSPIMAKIAKTQGIDFGHIWDSVNESKPTTPDGLKTATAIQRLEGDRYNEDLVGKGSPQRNFVNYNATDVDVEGNIPASNEVAYKTYAGKTEPTPTSEPIGEQPNVGSDEVDGKFDWEKQADVMSSVKLHQLVDLVKEVTGAVPQILKVLGKKPSNAVGLAYAKTGKIQLLASLAKNPKLADVVIAHELGHVINSMGEKERTFNRGGIFGAITSFYNYTAKALFESIKDRNSMGAEMDKIRADLRKQIAHEAKLRMKEGVKFGNITRVEWEKIEYSKRIDGALNANGYYTEKQVLAQLIPVVQWWNGQHKLGYVPTATEIYADAFSILLNDPVTLFKRAPIFSKMFQNWIETRPGFVEAYRKMANELSKGSDASYSKLANKILDGYLADANIRSKKEEKRTENKILKRAKTLSWALVYRLYPWQKIRDKLGLPVDITAIPDIELLGSASSVEAVFLHKIQANVQSKLAEHGISEDLFGLKLFVDRIIYGDRSKLFNPEGTTPEAASKIDELRLKKELGAEKYAALESIAESFHNVWQTELIEKYAPGVYNEKTVKALRANKWYATFATIQTLEEKEWGGEGSNFSTAVRAQIGTLKSTGNPYTASIDTALRLIYLSVRSRAAQAAVKMLRQYSPESIQDIELRGGRRMNKIPDGFRELYYLENGLTKGVYITNELYLAFDNNSNGSLASVVNFFKALEKYSGVGLIKMLFVNLNPGFWAWNILRDAAYSYTNLPEYKTTTGYLYSLMNTIGSLSSSYKYLRGTEQDAIVTKLLEEGVVHSAFDKEVRPETVGADVFMEKYNIFPKKDNFTSNAERAKYYFEWYQDFGRCSDLAGKRGQWIFLRKQHPDWSDRQLAYVVKNMTGTPNTAMAGVLAPIYNFALLYSHIALMGYRGSYESYKRDPMAFMSKVIITGVIPRLLYRAALMGWLDEEFFKSIGMDKATGGEPGMLKRFFQNIPERDLASYIIIPVPRLDKLLKGEIDFFTDDGKSIYACLPQDEFTRLSGGSVFLALTSLAEKDKSAIMGLLDAFFNASTYVAGQLPTITPPLQIAAAAISLLGEKNPTNSIGQNVIPQKHMAMGATSSESLKSFGAYSANMIGLGMFYSFKTDRQPKKPSGTLEDFLRTPIIGPALNRFVRVSNAGALTHAYRMGKQVAQENAKESHTMEEIMIDWWDQQVKATNKIPTTEQIDTYIGEFKETPEAKGKTFPQLRKTFYNTMIDGLNHGTYRLLTSGGSSEEKLARLKAMSEVKTRKEIDELVQGAMYRGIISGEFAAKYYNSIQKTKKE